MANRVKAFLIHLLISAALILFVLTISILLWYPDPYFEVVGVGEILIILALVDVSFGPLMTFIVFDLNKKSLKFDLTVIALIQLSALVYGASVVFAGRPAYLVYNIDRFSVVTASEILDTEMVRAKLTHLPLFGPEIVGAKLPSDETERAKILTSSLARGIDLPQMPIYYQPISNLVGEMKSRMLPLDDLINKQSAEMRVNANRVINESLSRQKAARDEVAYLPVRGKTKDMVMLIKRSDASIVELLPLSIWPE